MAAAVVLGFLFQGRILAGLGGYLEKASPPEKADIGFVLAGDFAGNRIVKAAELVRQGYVPVMVVSGPEGIYGAYECDLAISFAHRAGYPESYFLPFPNRAHSTREEAAMAVQKLRTLGAHRVLLVTSSYHTRRAVDLFRETAPDLKFVMVEAPDEHFTVDGWWHDRQARKIFLIEWLKTVAGWFRL